ncbi:alpha-mannosidase [Spirochaetia bacterium]|nr:alpha-mannosidase [Spirochaetia bacterium]
MLLGLERVGRMCVQLKGQVYSRSLAINEYDFADGWFHDPDDLKKQNLSWRKFKPGDLWGGRDVHGWFKAEVKIPEDWKGKTAALVFHTFETGWDAENPQFFLYVNGKLVQGLDQNHQEYILCESAAVGETYQIDLQAYGGMTGVPCTLHGKLVSVENDIRSLYYDLQVPAWACEKLDAGDKRRIDMLEVLNAAVNIIEFREPYSAEYFGSIAKARSFLEKEFYEKFCGHEDVTVTGAGHTHIDVAWRWTVAQTREKAGRSFSTVLNLMKKYPEYVFMMSQPQLYQFVKEDYPEIYREIKQRAQEGRWEEEGAMWLEADCNVTSGESLVRQILYGKKFFKEEFGVESTVLWLPDVFGYSAALPQILKKSGVNVFVTSKLSWNQFNRIPYDTFNWRGIDGTEILTYFITAKGPYQDKNSFFSTYNTELHPGSIKGAWDDYRQKDVSNAVMLPYGFGDGGGGPTFEMLEIGRRMARGIPGIPRFRFGNITDYFKDLEKKVLGNRRLPRWSGELYLEYHRGTYTSMARNKRDNRKSENTYLAAEKINTLAMGLGRPWPAETFKKNWTNILLNQFHDILPGSSIKEVYDVTDKEYRNILADGGKEAAGALAFIAARIPVKGRTLAAYNPLSFTRDDIVEFDLPAGLKQPVLIDASGNVYPAQIAGNRVVSFVRGIPANGYKTFRIEEDTEGKAASKNQGITINKKTLDNDFFHVEFDDAMNCSSIYDKRNRRELLKKGEIGKRLIAYEDIPLNFDNWDIDSYYVEKPRPVDDVEEAKVTEEGPVRYALEIKRRWNRSQILERIYIYPALDRIDFSYEIDWKQSQVLLKTAFPLDINANEATYEIQYGNITRPTHSNSSWDEARFESCGHSWADISEGGFGVSLLNDSKYGYDIHDGVMRLTLLKSGIDPNPTADQEIHHFTYSLYPHAGTWKEGGTHAMARRLNSALLAHVEESPHGGDLENEYSFVELNRDNVMIEVIKKAEDNDDIILRLYEYQNKRTEAVLKFHDSYRKIYECDLLERPLEASLLETSFLGENADRVNLLVQPYEIKTLRLVR